jgi:hypothetical protein
MSAPGIPERQLWSDFSVAKGSFATLAPLIGDGRRRPAPKQPLDVVMIDSSMRTLLSSLSIFRLAGEIGFWSHR